ncbi:MAG: hypothetical protein EOP34_10560 [Rickettsiales bacterium]|nr:MAG: hypothetical protein EOP34_10560 [Rickettsiales bacterium]
MYKIPRDEIVETISDLLKIKGIVVDEKSALFDTLKLYADTKLSIVDCLLISNAQHINYELHSFDKELLKVKNRLNEN